MFSPFAKKASNFYPSAKISKTNTTKISVTRKEKSLKGGENKEKKFENKISHISTALILLSWERFFVSPRN